MDPDTDYYGDQVTKLAKFHRWYKHKVSERILFSKDVVCINVLVSKETSTCIPSLMPIQASFLHTNSPNVQKLTLYNLMNEYCPDVNKSGRYVQIAALNYANVFNIRRLS